MNIKVTLFYFLAILISATLIVSCSDDGGGGDPTPPSVTAPSSQNINVGGSVDLTFNISTENGYQSASASADNGNAEITSQPETGASSGDVIVSYTGDTEGAATVTLTVTDQESQSDDGTVGISVGQEQTQVVRLTDDITSDTTWEDGTIYVLGGRIAVTNDATLTIEPGVIVRGEPGDEANATALIVTRDGNIQANGTADQPIIFTSDSDDITPEDIDNGNFGSPNLAPDNQGLWGGVLILGSAPISVSADTPGDVTEAQIEGIPASDESGRYGGDDPNDSSGSFTFVSIRHGGTNIGAGNEINGLSLGGVGTGTTIENIEIVANEDDGIEFFGGTVNVTNIAIWNIGDDAVDTDQDWAGTIDNMVIVSPGESGFELDGPEGDASTFDAGTAHTIQNGTVFMGAANSRSLDTSEELFDVDDNTDVNLSNIFFLGLRTNDDGSVANVVSDDYPDYADNDNGFAVTNLEAVIPSGFSVSDFFTGGSADVVTEVSGVGAATVGADVSVFGFTWTSTSGTLSDIGL